MPGWQSALDSLRDSDESSSDGEAAGVTSAGIDEVGEPPGQPSHGVSASAAGRVLAGAHGKSGARSAASASRALQTANKRRRATVTGSKSTPQAQLADEGRVLSLADLDSADEHIVSAGDLGTAAQDAPRDLASDGDREGGGEEPATSSFDFLDGQRGDGLDDGGAQDRYYEGRDYEGVRGGED